MSFLIIAPLWAIDIVNDFAYCLAAFVDGLLYNGLQITIVKSCGLVEKPFCFEGGKFVGGGLAAIRLIFYG